MQHSQQFLRSVLVLALVLMVHQLAAQRISVNGNQFVVDGQRIWLNGANTPWDNWNDFGGSFDYQWWNDHFQTLKDKKVNSTRVWITCNGEVGININEGGYVSGATDAFWSDVDQLMQIAQDKEIYLMVALISFDHVKDSHSNYQRWRNMMDAPGNRQSFVDNFATPFVDRYRDNPYFFAIDVSNEIEWMFEEHGVSVGETQDLVARVANMVHSRSDVLVCQGLGLGPKYASPLYEGNYYSDAALSAKQNGAYLDFYKLHFYGWQNAYFGNPFDTSPAAWQINDKPCVIGEAAAKGSAGYTPQQCTQRAFEQDWQGYMPWTSNGVDSNGDISDMDNGSEWFHSNYPDLVYPSTNPAPPGNGGSPHSPVSLNAWDADALSAGITDNDGWGLGDVGAGEWFMFSGVDLGNGYDNIEAEFASTESGALGVRLGSPTGTKIGEINWSSSGGWGTFAWRFGSLTGGSGVQDLYLVMESGTANIARLRLNDTNAAARTAPIADQKGSSLELSNTTVRVYPNPSAGGSVTVAGLEQGSDRVEMRDLQGRAVPIAVQALSTRQVRIQPRRAVSKGLYIIRVRRANHKIIQQKLIVE